MSFREVWDGMDWPDYLALNKHWKRWPPPAIALAVLARLTPKAEADEAIEARQEPTEQEMMAALGPPTTRMTRG